LEEIKLLREEERPGDRRRQVVDGVYVKSYPVSAYEGDSQVFIGQF
jgi:hypothetical protein